MEQLDMNFLLNRQNLEETFRNAIDHFEKNKKNQLVKRGIYLYGPPGGGKTMFVEKILKKMNYDIIKYDAGDVRN